MFQSFQDPSPANRSRPRLAQLRELMSAAGVQAYLVPRADEFQGEYVPPSAERLKWLTGFSGSAGIAVVGLKTAALFVDGRYTIQAKDEVDTTLFELQNIPRTPVAKWIKENLQAPKCTIGYDPRLHTPNEIKRLATGLAHTGIALKPVSRFNLVDRAWGMDRPAEPTSLATVQPLKFSGRSAKDKIDDIQEALAKDGHDAAILTLPDSICWLLNIRGSDVAHNPVVLCFAILPRRGKVELFIALEKVDAKLRAHLAKTTRIRDIGDLKASLAKLKKSKKRVRLDPATAAIWFESRLAKSQISHAPDPCILPKAIKNNCEIDGTRAAHLRDGIAITRLLAWLEREASTGKLDEIAVAQHLECLRAEANELREISFDTISSAGPNGAIVHYRVTNRTNRKLKPGELFLLDSGAQYQDGTTDITRTVAIGKPTKQMRTHFTLVLKGHIAIATARLPKGSRGVDLDPFARQALWSHGLDYDHGTGHGVGSYLSVHEGPASISKTGLVPLKSGMILSNEPGYYHTGHYGIRIENLILVESPTIPQGGDREMLSFETLTLAPIDRNLIDTALLSQAERKWLNDYHTRVMKKLSPHLDATTRNWLKTATTRF